MSRLYIRVMTSFYAHKKTMRLRARIGDDAYWIPPKLWAFAAENQPDGNLSGYTGPELAMLLGCEKYATSILEALQHAGFIDSDGVIHDWSEHNGYHSRFSARGRAAAAARWSKEERSPTPSKEEVAETESERGKGKGETSIATSMLDACKKHNGRSAPVFPDSLKVPDFEKAWADWLEHLSQKKKKPTLKAMEAQLAKCAEIGPVRAVAMIRHSIAGNYQGLFEDNKFSLEQARNGSERGQLKEQVNVRLL